MIQHYGSLTTLLAFTSLLISCSTEPRLSGTWELWSVDGLPVAEAFPTRTEIPAQQYGDRRIDEGDAWGESSLESSILVVLPDGDVEEVRVTTTTIAMTAETYRRVTGSPHFGDEVVRETSAPDTSHILAHWRLDGDSIVIYQTPQEIESQLAANMREMMPNTSEEELREAASAFLSNFEIPYRGRGFLDGDRFDLRSRDGQVLVYRRRLEAVRD